MCYCHSKKIYYYVNTRRMRLAKLWLRNGAVGGGERLIRPQEGNDTETKY